MSGSDATQREVIERLSIILHPARATMPAAQGAPGEAGRAASSLHRPSTRRDIRIGALQQRYRLYRVCGYGIVSACYYATKSPTW
jgi:hypothetical protein